MQKLWTKIKGLFIKRTVSERILYACIFVVFSAFAFSYVYALVWCILSGLKTHDSIVMRPFELGKEWNFKNYAELSRHLKVGKTDFWGMLGNSVYFSVFGAFFATMCTAMTAYVTSKYKFKGSEFYFLASLVMMVLPIYGTGGSMYLLLDRLNILDSPLMIITSMGGLGVNYMYFHAFFQNVSWSYAEAAQLDGASDWTIFFRVMLPQAMPMFGAIFLLIWMSEWNNYSSALLYLPNMPTLAVGIFLFQQDMTSSARLDILYAGCFLTCIPPLVLFICFNKVLMNNVSLGGIKE